jgi:hypothetical protein
MCARVAFGLSILLALVCPSLAQEPKETTLKPTLVFRGTHSAVRKERFAVVTGETEWKDVWKQHRGKEYDPPFTEKDQELSVNFETHYVVAVFTKECDECVITPRMRGADVVIGFRMQWYSTEGRPPLGEDKRTEREKATDEAREAKEAAKAPYAFVILPKPVKAVVIEKDVRRSKFDPPLWKEESRYPVPKDKK